MRGAAGTTRGVLGNGRVQGIACSLKLPTFSWRPAAASHASRLWVQKKALVRIVIGSSVDVYVSHDGGVRLALAVLGRLHTGNTSRYL